MTVDAVLVAGAPGRRRRAAVAALLDTDLAVHVLVRDDEGEAARAIAARGATTVRGRVDQLDHVDDALADVDALLAHPGRGDAESVLARGRTLARAAERAAVEHAVFTSVGNADAEPGVPGVDAAASVESAVGERDVTATVVRTHYPMQALERHRAAVRDGAPLRLPLEWGARVTLTDAADVGRLAARAFADPEAFAGTTVELVGARHTLPDVADAVAAVAGWDVDYEYGGVDAAPRGESAFVRWLNEGGLGAGVEVGVDVPEFAVTSLRAYLSRAEWGGGDA